VPSFRVGEVVEMLHERPGLQRLLVDLGRGGEKAYCLTQLTPPVAVGDRVVVNTTAVELGLGTGGWHVVHWNLARDEWREPGPGHVMKVRYTSVQSDVGSTEEHAAELADVQGIGGMPVVAASLHSQLAAIAVALKDRKPGARLAYVMTDGASLPIAISDLVWALRRRGLVDVTITCGHAFGGDREAIGVHSALAIARHVEQADVTVVAMGPGSAGTATTLGFSGLQLGAALDAADGLGGAPVAALRMSRADPRPRHTGVSHHSVTSLLVGTRSRVRVAVPDEAWAEACAALGDRHELVRVPPAGILAKLDAHGLRVESMGRAAADDPILFECAAAAGAVAADLLP
jgi:hypothetical protein